MKKIRYEPLDGLRGLAALIVVFYHFASAFYPAVVPAQSARVPAWVDWPTGIFLNGPFAVDVFFVLSGFVLANSSLKHRPHLLRDCLLRYLRLAIPATVSVVIAWLLLSAYPNSAWQLHQLIPSTWLLDTHQNQIPSLGHALREGLWDIFINGKSRFNNVLWTMRTELVGSLAIFVFFQFIKRYRFALLVLTGVLVSTSFLSRPYLAFVLGAILCLLARDGFSLGRPGSLMIFIFGVVFGAQGQGFSNRIGLGDLPWLITPGDSNSLFYPLAAAAIVAGVLTSKPLKIFFATSPLLFLGRISFPLYLLHVPLIYTVVASAALFFSSDFAPSLSVVVLLGVPFLLASIAIACIFEHLIDLPLLRGLQKLRQRPTHIASAERLHDINPVVMLEIDPAKDSSKSAQSGIGLAESSEHSKTAPAHKVVT